MTITRSHLGLSVGWVLFEGWLPPSGSALSLLVDVPAASAWGPPHAVLLDVDLFQRMCSPGGTLWGQGVCVVFIVKLLSRTVSPMSAYCVRDVAGCVSLLRHSCPSGLTPTVCLGIAVESCVWKGAGVRE